MQCPFKTHVITETNASCICKTLHLGDTVDPKLLYELKYHALKHWILVRSNLSTFKRSNLNSDIVLFAFFWVFIIQLFDYLIHEFVRETCSNNDVTCMR